MNSVSRHVAKPVAIGTVAVGKSNLRICHGLYVIRAQSADQFHRPLTHLGLAFQVLRKPAASRLNHCFLCLRLMPLAHRQDGRIPAALELRSDHRLAHGRAPVSGRGITLRHANIETWSVFTTSTATNLAGLFGPWKLSASRRAKIGPSSRQAMRNS